eukprot:Phypoly_transcript_07070.p1 GENE.Phypoly_transcript_07070~~Phypoly_transcript_07070.p1  ORF type:complete len:544 (+),score=63.96 Phypoly_transcript_07070:199-1632(+)
MSVWCYSCDSYIKHPSLVNILRYARAVKFYGEDFIESQKNAVPEECIKPSFLEKWEQTSTLLHQTPQNTAQLIELIQKIGKLTNAAAEPLKHFFETQLSESQRSAFFTTTLPHLLRHILLYPSLFPEPIPVLVQQKDAELKLNRLQIASILSVSFMCMWDHPNYRYFNKRNFSDLYLNLKEEWEAMKLRAVLQYFETIFSRDKQTLENEYLKFGRQVVALDQFPDWETCEDPITDLGLHKGSIEDVKDHLHADFANKYIGGGVLAGGCVQEELLFAENTELIASCLFIPVIQDNEAVILRGSEKFSTHTGYGFTARWHSKFDDPTAKNDRHEAGMISSEIVAMDATDYRYASSQMQYHKEGFLRELNKAYVAFAIGRHSRAGPVATGNWGCGAFLGDKHYKFIIQLLAASKAGRYLTYCCFGDKELEENIVKIHITLKNKGLKIRDVYASLVAYQTVRQQAEPVPFFTFLEQSLESK